MNDAQPATGLSRRGLLGGLALGTGGLMVGAATGYAVAASPDGEPEPGSIPELGSAVIPCHGAHQAGLDTPMAANATFVALDLMPEADRESLVRMMRLLTDDIVRLTEGRPALADPQPELAAVPARLTVTVGFGLGLLRAAGLASEAPHWLRKGLPSFTVDKLTPQWSGGDVLLQVAAEDPVTVSHAVRVLVTDSRPFATVRWSQSGFHRPAGTAPVGVTGRNLMGQVDGTVNPQLGSDDFDRVVWEPPDSEPAWLRGGTAAVVRRIAMDLTTWGGLDETAKEEAMGRRLSDGAPLTGGTEFTGPDFEATNDLGLPVIGDTAHIRLAHPQAADERILRRPYNYDDGPQDAGLIFAAYMANPATQFIPIQRRLADLDVMNLWTTPIGSALFAIPAGFSEGEYIGQTLLG